MKAKEQKRSKLLEDRKEESELRRLKAEERKAALALGPSVHKDIVSVEEKERMMFSPKENNTQMRMFTSQTGKKSQCREHFSSSGKTKDSFLGNS